MSDDDKKRNLNVDHMVGHLTGVILPFINSAMNPIIMIMRGRDLKEFIRGLFRRVSVMLNVVCSVDGVCSVELGSE